jgi:hypothetical protein
LRILDAWVKSHPTASANASLVSLVLVILPSI